jgi:O6-methylguanine-DNA--protein-cysteine methyltransferase
VQSLVFPDTILKEHQVLGGYNGLRGVKKRLIERERA